MNKNISTIGITVRHSLSAELKGELFEMISFLQRHKKKVLVTEHTASLIKNHPQYSTVPVLKSEESWKELDLFIFFGGDGTLLKSISSFAPAIFSVPIFGINAGNLGFFSSVPISEQQQAFSQIFHGEYSIDERMLLHGTIEQEKEAQEEEFFALNEASIHHSGIARLRSFRTHISGELLTHYSADGLIISTPTGSTAYNMAAGGSIIAPQIEAISITPLAPSGFSQRAIVLPSSKIITITPDAEMTVSVDGQSYFTLSRGKKLKLTQHTQKLRFIRLPSENYFKNLREKLGWG